MCMPINLKFLNQGEADAVDGSLAWDVGLECD